MEQSRLTRPRKAPDPIFDVIEPALKVGAACGAAGFLFGGASGIVRGLPPVLSGGVSSLQTFSLGATFYVVRSTILQAWTVDGQLPAPQDLTKASALAGGFSGGTVGLVFRGRSNVIPGVVMFAIFGAAGQYLTNTRALPKDVQPKENFWKRMGKKNWTPFKILSDDEYAEMLREKMLRLDVEIALLDDKMAALREQDNRKDAKG